MQKFIIFSAGYNCENYIQKHMESVNTQDYSHYRHIIIDDASSDATYDTGLKHATDKTTIFKNTHNLCWNHNAVKYLTPNIEHDEEVLVFLDLDDWFARTDALSILNNLYEQHKAWVVYGQFDTTDPRWPGHFAAPMPQKIRQSRMFRRGKWIYNPPRTFKAFLWLNIKDEDFRDDKGEYLKVTYDRSIMLPALEMTPTDKIIYNPIVLYTYNLHNPLGDEKIHHREQVKIAEYIAYKPPYEILER